MRVSGCRSGNSRTTLGAAAATVETGAGATGEDEDGAAVFFALDDAAVRVALLCFGDAMAVGATDAEVCSEPRRWETGEGLAAEGDGKWGRGDRFGVVHTSIGCGAVADVGVVGEEECGATLGCC